MKFLYHTPKYKRHSRSVERRAQKRRLIRNRRGKAFQRAIYHLPKKERREWNTKKKYKTIVSAPENLAFLEDPDSVFGFIKKLETVLEKTKSLYVEMKYVKKIDYPMIAALLAVLYRSRKNGIKINGNMPPDPTARSILQKSGFIYTLFSKDPEAGHKHDINADNQLFTLDTRDLGVVREIVETVSQFLVGKKKKIPGLYTTLGELMDNTATHAAEQQGANERWWLSINYDQANKKAEFVFIDYGIGIFTSLRAKTNNHPVKNLLVQAQSAFGMDATEEHLKSIVTKSAKETYKLKPGRGEGIYGIYQALGRNEIANLRIASNNAFGDVSKNAYKRLKNQLNGTLYYWDIHANNVK